MRRHMPGDPFTIEFPPDAPLSPHRAGRRAAGTPVLGRVAQSVTRPLLSWLLQLETYRSLYQEASSRQGTSFARRAMEVLDISVDCGAAGLSHVPVHGPL